MSREDPVRKSTRVDGEVKQMGYQLEMTDEAMIIRGPIPVSEMIVLTELAARRGFNRLDIGLAQVYRATAVITSTESSGRLRKRIDEANADKTAEDAWIDGYDTGVSSRAIFAVMTGRMEVMLPYGPEHPLDPDDFGRCYRLLEKFPQWKRRLSEVGNLSPQWRRLTEHWTELEELYREGLPTTSAPKLYARMQRLIAGE
jgi:hypothetical protein